MIVREFTVKQEIVGQREAIQANLGRQVILKDGNESWCHGILLTTGYDQEVYRINIADDRGERQLYYHDLVRLLTIEYHPEYPSPEIPKQTGTITDLPF